MSCESGSVRRANEQFLRHMEEQARRGNAESEARLKAARDADIQRQREHAETMRRTVEAMREGG